MSKYSFCKDERLKGIQSFKQLFDNGESFLVYPVRVVWMPSCSEQLFPVRAAFSVSGKLFPGAADRNLLKRRMKEAYRFKKDSLYKKCSDKKFALVFIYIAREKLPYRKIEKAVSYALEKLARKIT